MPAHPEALAPAGSRPEVELLLCCARTRLPAALAERVRSLAAGDLDWSYLLWLARSHRVLPLLCRHLQAICPDALPEAIARQLASYARALAQHNLLQTAELLRLVRVFSSEGIRAVPFKGPMLAVTAYGDLSLRQFADLDLLIGSEDVIGAARLLAVRGYQPQYAFAPGQQAALIRFQHAHLFVSADREYHVDLHWSAMADGFVPLPDPGRPGAPLQQVTLANTPVWTIPPAELLLILCLHGSKHHWERLAWICDMAELIGANPALDWGWLQARAQELGSRRMVALGLLLAGDLLAAPIPAEVRRWADADAAVRPLVARVHRRLAREAGSGGWREHLFIFSLRERLRDKLRFACTRAVTPTVADIDLVRLPPSLTFLYYLLRPVSLIVRRGLGALLRDRSISPFAPVPRAVAERMLGLAGVGPTDVVCDLGCGDGQIVVTAAKQYGARAIGYDLDPSLLALARANAAREGVQHLVTFIQQDMLAADLSQATVVTSYLPQEANLQLQPMLRRRLRPGTRLVSCDSDMGDWMPSRTVLTPHAGAIDYTLYLWQIGEPQAVGGDHA